jgi:hypothetical protein
MGSQGGGRGRDAIPSTHGTVKKEPDVAGLPVIDVTCFNTEARCCSIPLEGVERTGVGVAGAVWPNIIPENAAIAKIHLILIFYRPPARNSE